jgi:hypothetical protein
MSDWLAHFLIGTTGQVVVVRSEGEQDFGERSGSSKNPSFFGSRNLRRDMFVGLGIPELWVTVSNWNEGQQRETMPHGSLKSRSTLPFTVHWGAPYYNGA